MINPFTVQTPDGMDAQDAIDLFVDMFSEYFHVDKVGHTFIHGHRGSGKSMMFRLMEPDCQQLYRKKPLEKLPYFGIYIPIKATNLNILDFARLKNKLAEAILAEHALVAYIASKTVTALQKNTKNLPGKKALTELSKFIEKYIEKISGPNKSKSNVSTSDVVQPLVDLFDELYNNTTDYLKRLTFSDTDIPYSGFLLGFYDFLLPFLKDLKNLSFLPSGPIFLLIDDADNLNTKQTEILNTWVSYRTIPDVCFKIVTQMNYKTYKTINEIKIDAPHDFSEIYISDIYTSSREKYPEWVYEIVRKRLHKAGIKNEPEAFFPEDSRQEEKIKVIAQAHRSNWKVKGRGYRANDDAYRYARPDFIKQLRGSRKQGSTYKYAGFIQLIHVSSGIIRHFLESASLMYSEQQKKDGNKPVDHIEPSIQNKVLRDLADEFVLSEFERLLKDEKQDPVLKLKNLIMALGGMFQYILLSDAAERRVFSFAISDELDPDVRAVISFGVQCGYFQQSSVGNKEGTGRTRLYILSRRIAPHFLLDPTGFSGYKFVTNQFLMEAMANPKKALGHLKKYGVDKYIDNQQQDLFSQDTQV